MGRKATKGERTLRTERTFEASRLGRQVMAASYEALIPIKRKRLTDPVRPGSAVDADQAAKQERAHDGTGIPSGNLRQSLVGATG